MVTQVQKNPAVISGTGGLNSLTRVIQTLGREYNCRWVKMGENWYEWVCFRGTSGLGALAPQPEKFDAMKFLKENWLSLGSLAIALYAVTKKK